MDYPEKLFRIKKLEYKRDALKEDLKQILPPPHIVNDVEAFGIFREGQRQEIKEISTQISKLLEEEQ